LHLFGETQAQGLSPNVVTCASLLDGLCKNGQLNEAIAKLKEMEKNQQRIYP